MVKAKVVFIAHVDTEFKNAFIENCSSNMEVVRAFSNPKATQEEVADIFGSDELRDADFLVLFCRWRVPEEAIRGARHLKFIQTLGQGLNISPYASPRSWESCLQFGRRQCHFGRRAYRSPHVSNLEEPAPLR